MRQSTCLGCCCVTLAFVFGCALPKGDFDEWFTSSATRSSIREESKSPEFRFARYPLTFVADFDLSPKHPLIEEMLALRERVAGKLGFPRPEEPLQVFLYSDQAAFDRFWKSRFPDAKPRRAVFLETPARRALYIHWGNKAAEDARHEVSHGYLHSIAPAIPLWLDEGLAEYFETPAESQGVNLPHVEALLAAKKNDGWRPDLRRLESIGGMGDLRQADYAEAWLWAHWLLESTPERSRWLHNYLENCRLDGAAPPLAPDLEARQFNLADAVLSHLEGLAKAQTIAGDSPSSRYATP